MKFFLEKPKFSKKSQIFSRFYRKKSRISQFPNNLSETSLNNDELDPSTDEDEDYDFFIRGAHFSKKNFRKTLKLFFGSVIWSRSKSKMTHAGGGFGADDDEDMEFFLLIFFEF